MIEHRTAGIGHISVWPLRFFLFLSILMIGCMADDSEQINNTESPTLPASSKSTQRINILDMTTAAPDSWLAVEPSSSMRLVQFVISDVEQAEVIVFYFGAGQGGGPQANIDRWLGQFKPKNGKTVQPMVTNMKTRGGFPVTWVEIKGDYARGVGVGPKGGYKSAQMLIAAITKTSRGNLYFQLHGDRETVLRHRDEFMDFVIKLQNGSD